MARKEVIDRKKLKYVLYTRKSMTDEGSQVRSLGDQKLDCLKIAEREGLNVVKILEAESQSAKKPGKRPIFTQMLKDIEAKKYDAILCWHPDRLCRNMLEGGQVINMLDEGTLKDVYFHSHNFSNDANGKMLLGMLFVFSKQYSDDLSDKVNRGVEGNLSEGKSSGSPKWGYDRDDTTGIYERNEYFELVKGCWKMRAEGATNKEVLEYLLDNDYHRMTKINRKNRISKRIDPTEKTIGVMFKDSFYYGILVQVNQTVDLTLLYNFIPMISHDTYNKVQSIGYTRKKDVSVKKNSEFKPLRGFVHCDVCKSSRYMVVGKNKPGGSVERVLTYRCDNPSCKRSVKTVYASYIFDGIMSQIKLLNLTDEAYERYSKVIDKNTNSKILDIKQDIASLRGTLAHKTSELEDLSLNLGKISKKSPAYAINYNKIQSLANEQNDIRAKITKLKRATDNPARIKMTKEQFLNLAKSIGDKMKAGNAIEKDSLARILFLNLFVDNERALSVIWREPFASLIKASEISSGARERT